MPSSHGRGACSNIVAGTSKVRNAIAASQRRKKHRDDLMQSGQVMIDRTLTVSTRLFLSFVSDGFVGKQQSTVAMCV